MRPCKIWAAYVGHCVEKVYHQNQNMLTPLNKAQKIHIRETPTLLTNADCRTDQDLSCITGSRVTAILNEGSGS